MKRAAWAISADFPKRPSGTGAITFSSISGFMASSSGVRVKPGAIAPTRIWWRASSRAHTTVIEATPALAAL